MRTRAVVAMVIAAVLSGAPPARATVRTLVAIGNDVGLSSEEPLRWAEADAERIADVMVDVGGVTSSRAIVLRGRPVADIERALLEVKGQVEEVRRRGERAELVVTYSGHGDAKSLHVDGTALPVSQLLAWLDSIPADATLVVLDACRTGVARSGNARGASRAAAFDVTLVEEPGPLGRVVIASASDGEVAQESDELEGAFFTHHLLAGLRGAADDNHDGVVVLAELYAYAHGRTVMQSFSSASVQHPELRVDLRGQGEMVMTRLLRAQATLVLDDDLAGAFLIADARSGRVLFEVHKPSSRALALAVPARRLRIQRRAGSRWSHAEIDVTRGGQAVLGAGDLVEAPRVAGRGRGIDLDPTPWGMGAAAFLTATPALPGGSVGGLVRAERRIGETPLLGEVLVAGARARGADATFLYDELDGRLVIGLAAETWTLVGRFSAGVGAGLHGAWQRVERKDADRLRAAGLDLAAARDGWTLGPTGAVRLGWWIPVAGPLAVEAGAFGGVSGLVIDERLQPRVWGGISCGLAVEL